jgi:uncharacterized protein with FMN-binding domain
VKRALAATVATAGGLAALLSYKSGKPPSRLATTAPPSTTPSTAPSSGSSGTASTAPSTSDGAAGDTRAAPPATAQSPATAATQPPASPTTQRPATSTTEHPSTTTTTQAPPASTSPPTTATATASYTDGTYTGLDAPNRYGDVQVQAVIRNGRLADVVALQLPQDRARSQQISEYSAPILHDEAIQSQNAQIDGVSGATYTSTGYAQSLQAALDAARRS